MKRTRGFTLTEAIVVIAIIGVLTAIISVTVREYRIRAEASALVQQLGELETAFRAYRQYELQSGWPSTGASGIAMQTIISDGSASFPNFSNYFPGNLNTFNNYTVEYNYQTPFVDCGGPDGVHIVIDDPSGAAAVDIYPRVETMIDGTTSDVTCGKFNSSGSESFYLISESTFSY